jgi:wyosine [tRNA(Phe)-imidazoG37] synthetase (radical SAM superfamily)
MRRAKYVPERDVVDEVKAALAEDSARTIDWITFVGSGETLLHAKIGWMLRAVKELTDIPVAVITNGSLLCQPYVRWELAVADAVLPSLDAGNEATYRKINRPHRGVSFERHVEGLAAFRDEYHGALWVEVMLVQGMNDSEREVESITATLQRLHPDQVHINGPSRSPVEPWVKYPEADIVSRISRVIGSVAPVRVVRSSEGVCELAADRPVIDAVANVVMRHPLSRSELVRALELFEPNEVHENLSILEESDRLQVVFRSGTEYWVSATTHFPDGSGSSAAVVA